MVDKVAEKFTKKAFDGGNDRDEEPLELTEVVEEPSNEEYVLYGAGARPKGRRRSLIDLSALEEVALSQAHQASAEFLAERGPEILAEQAREVLAETARQIAPQVAQEVFREKAGEVLSAVAEEAALRAAREVFREFAAEVLERVAREMVPKVAEEIIEREIERIKTSVRQGLT
jgi:hypothetical protein